jgi:eukaryotic-like serine/threonine-protein kinase
MGLSAGARLGPYEILAPLGAGGMGEVYRARDTKLRRDVAIKILPEIFTSDPERLARFEREAQMLAALNHSHIGAIYGVEDAGGVRALVLELVEGETLAERLRRGSIPAAEALAIARQIADALEAAHERSIIHRDLKPANIKTTPDGQVKVLDFGLAKTVVSNTTGPDLSQSPTLTASSLSGGAILGTAAYMSPEQARGKTVDKRTDIWAYGCVLYEMLTGRKAFAGETASDAIAAILQREPDWTKLPAAVPAPVSRLLRRCLEKDPNRRLRDIGDARLEVDDALSSPTQADLQKPAVMTRRNAISALAGAAVGAATGVFAIRRYRGPVRRDLTQFSIGMPEGEVLRASFERHLAISPDSNYVAYSGDNFYIRPLRDLKATKVEGAATTEGDAPFFSPDSRSLGFVLFEPNIRIQRMALSGGAPTNVCRVGSVAGQTWADDDNIYFVSQMPGGILGVPSSGGQPKEVAKIDFASGEHQHRDPCALPGGKAVLFTVANADTETFDDAHIAVLSLQTGQKKVLIEPGMHPRYSPSGHLVYARNGNLLAVRFDPHRLEVQGQPFTVLEGVLMSRNTGAANYDISAAGDLIYAPGKADGGARTLFWVDRNGKAERAALPSRSYLHPRLSPDARLLAIEVEGPNHDFYIYDFARDVLSKMTTDGVSHWPVWSPDGSQLAYRSGPMGEFKLWQVAADRSRPPQQVAALGVSQSAESWSPDGRAIAYTASAIEVPPSIMVVSVGGDRPAQPFNPTKFAQGSPKFSPDGRWLAYCSNESGKPQVYVQAYPGPGPKTQVSTDGGTDPVWKRTGGELYYRNSESMMAVDVSTAPTFSAGRPKELWKGHYSHGMSSSCGTPGATSSNFDVTADGKRFLMIKDDDQDTAASKQIVVVLGWADELNRLAKV